MYFRHSESEKQRYSSRGSYNRGEGLLKMVSSTSVNSFAFQDCQVPIYMTENNEGVVNLLCSTGD